MKALFKQMELLRRFLLDHLNCAGKTNNPNDLNRHGCKLSGNKGAMEDFDFKKNCALVDVDTFQRLRVIIGWLISPAL